MKERHEILLTGGFLVIAFSFVVAVWHSKTTAPSAERFVYNDATVRAESEVFVGDTGSVTAPSEKASTRTLALLRQRVFSSFGGRAQEGVKPLEKQTAQEVDVTIAHASPEDVPVGFTFDSYLDELKKIAKEKKAAEEKKKKKKEKEAEKEEQDDTVINIINTEDDSEEAPVIEIVSVDIGEGLTKPYYPVEDENDQENQVARTILIENAQRNGSFGEIFTGGASSTQLTFTADDAHQQRMLEELQGIQLWAGNYDVIISEMGITSNDDDAKYIALMDRFFAAANPMGIHTTAWAIGDWWGGYGGSLSSNSQISATGVSAPFVNNPSTSQYVRGLNLAGGEFGMDPDANGDRGTINNQYTYHIGSGLWQAMKNRGFTHARFPFRLERLFNDDGSFRETDKQHLVEAIGSARSAGMKILLDPHNYGAMKLNGSKHVLGGSVFTQDLYAKMMGNLGTLATEHSDVIDMIGLMNEPKNVSAGDWEVLAQAGVTALRNAGYEDVIEVPTANWQGIQDAPRLHPNGPWITDPENNIYYGVHQYFDENHSGHYLRTYAQDESDLLNNYTPGNVTVWAK